MIATLHACANRRNSEAVDKKKMLRNLSSFTFDPLYLFTCCLVWYREDNEQARLAVIRALISRHRCTRQIAATFLLGTVARDCKEVFITFG
jgi:hypothetical protein